MEAHTEEGTSGVGQRLREARDARGWTQGQLAEKSQVSRTLISRIESGERFPKIGTLEKLATALRVPVERLTGDDGEVAEEWDPDIAAINANLLTMRDLSRAELQRVAVVVKAMVEDLQRRRREEDDAERRRR